ncbi:MAG: 3-hydroxyacyl-CoA dehydrogenase family protein [Bacteroidia bacterium]
MRILILGAGTMGRGIAEVFAAHDIAVSLYDPDPLALQRIESLIEKYTARVSFIRELSADLSYEIVIEAIPEDLALKQKVLGEVSRRMLPDSLLTTNTSALSVHLLAQAVEVKSRFLGWHFFNPAPRMPLVEVIPTAFTAEAVIERSLHLLRKVGKVPVVAPDLPGFIVNRIARPYYVEALRLAERGEVSPEVVDQLMEGLGFRMGPFRLMDLIGIDVNHAVTQRVWEGLFYPARFRPSWLQAQKVAAGQTGRKVGRGFYEYDQKRS